MTIAATSPQGLTFAPNAGLEWICNSEKNDTCCKIAIQKVKLPEFGQEWRLGCPDE
jgi:hypothetical protein